MTRPQLAKLIDKSASTINQIEMFGVLPSLDTCKLIAQALGVTVNDISEFKKYWT